MKSHFAVRRALSAGIAAFAALTFAAACSDDAGDGSEGATDSTDAASDGDFNDADVTFAQMMVPHHEQAVDMAALAQEHAEDPEVLALADQIAAAQQPEIDQMTGLLESWGEPTEMEGHEGMSMGGMASDEQMTELEGAHGADFDRLFVELMITHHEGAITMAEEHHMEGQNAELMALAEAIIESQTAEVVALQEMLARL
jgi:uncharacterized protein (DUF305 family)